MHGFFVGIAAFVGLLVAALASTSTNETAGELYMFGRMAPDAEPVRLNESDFTPLLENEGMQYRAVAAGTTAAEVITTNGTAARIEDPLATQTLKGVTHDPSGFGFCQTCKGNYHTVAVTCDGEAYLWGVRASLRDEDGKGVSLTHPQKLDLANDRVIQISCGETHTLLLTEDRDVFAIGEVSYGRLGAEGVEGEVDSIWQPILVPSLSKRNLPDNDTVCFVNAGGKSSFAVTEKGEMYSWGANEFGQLALSKVSHHESAPARVFADPPFVACEVASGKEFALGYDDKGDVWTWGAGVVLPERFGQSPLTQVMLSLTEERAVMLAAGDYHAAILADNGTVFTYGYNRYGQLGVNLTAAFTMELGPFEFEPESPIWTLEPRRVQYLDDKNIRAIYARGNYTLAHSKVMAPHNCPCARGGRGPTKFGIPGSNGPKPEQYVPRPPPRQPKKFPSDLYLPVAPFVGKKLVPREAPAPGEVVPTEPRRMQDVEHAHMNDFIPKKPELPKRPAVSYLYPSDSNERRAFDGTGIDRDVDQALFGRKLEHDGYWYGDDDGEVDDPRYYRDAEMSSSKSSHKMPEPFHGADMTAGLRAWDRLGSVKSLSLQDVKASRERGAGDSAMHRSLETAVQDLQGNHAPVDFVKIARIAKERAGTHEIPSVHKQEQQQQQDDEEDEDAATEEVKQKDEDAAPNRLQLQHKG